MAARLYASGAVPTKKAACEAVGLHPAYLTILSSSGNETINRLMSEVDEQIADDTVALSSIIAKLSRRALLTMKGLMTSQNEHVALRASSDILDRNPETSKTFKATVTAFHLDGTDAKELAAALVAGARVKEKFLPIAAGDFVKVDEGEPTNGKAPRVQGDSGGDREARIRPEERGSDPGERIPQGEPGGEEAQPAPEAGEGIVPTA